MVSAATHLDLVFLITLRNMIFCRRSYMWPVATVNTLMVSSTSATTAFLLPSMPDTVPQRP